jgi:hypothetical protein
MRPKTAETLAWVLIYSGLLLASLGLFVRQTQAVAGTVLIVAGLLGAAAGVGLIWLRSRMAETTVRPDRQVRPARPDRPDKETR